MCNVDNSTTPEENYEPTCEQIEEICKKENEYLHEESFVDNSLTDSKKSEKDTGLNLEILKQMIASTMERQDELATLALILEKHINEQHKKELTTKAHAKEQHEIYIAIEKQAKKLQTITTALEKHVNNQNKIALATKEQIKEIGTFIFDLYQIRSDNIFDMKRQIQKTHREIKAQTEFSLDLMILSVVLIAHTVFFNHLLNQGHTWIRLVATICSFGLLTKLAHLKNETITLYKPKLDINLEFDI